jgi:hypothetical protein
MGILNTARIADNGFIKVICFGHDFVKSTAVKTCHELMR